MSPAPLSTNSLLRGVASASSPPDEAQPIANVAAARGVTLTEVTSTVTGDIDLRGILGISKDVRNGYERIAITFDVKGDAPEAKLREIVEQSRARSAVFDVLTNGTRVDVQVDAA